MSSRISGNSFIFENVYIQSVGTTAGIVEHQGPLGHYFDKHYPDHYHHQKSYEQAEIEMLKDAILLCLKKGKVKKEDIDLYFGGDLNNQITACYYYASHLYKPFIGLYSACSTIGLALANASIMIENHNIHSAIACTVSHNATAERQFRFPLELGTQRPPTAQWTVTGAGAAILSNSGEGPRITNITPGKIVDMGIKDANNMGAAMAPAALDTLMVHFQDTGRKPSYYDAIISGDLGYIGKEIVQEMAQSKGYNIKANYNDCGVLMFDKEKQDTHSWGSGCACIATLFSGYFFKQLKEGKLKRILLIATGALMNSTSMQQGETIPGIAHAISIEM